MIYNLQDQISWLENKIASKEKQKRDAKERGLVFAVKTIDEEMKMLKSIIKALALVKEKEDSSNPKAA
jgi:phosphohistidine swiveling domain-containing protein